MFLVVQINFGSLLLVVLGKVSIEISHGLREYILCKVFDIVFCQDTENLLSIEIYIGLRSTEFPNPSYSAYIKEEIYSVHIYGNNSSCTLFYF